MAKSEADMIMKILKVNTIEQLISLYIDRLPSSIEGVVADMTPCFYHSVQKAANFCSILQLVVKEYTIVNK